MIKRFLAGGGTSSRIVKALSIFGSVQVLSVLASAVRVKLIAILIGPVGVGIYSIFWQTMELLRNVGGMNLSTPTVSHLSNLRNDPQRLRESEASLRRTAAWLGVATMLVAALGAHWLSRFAFGNSDYTLWFVALSPMVALCIFGNVNSSIMQARERLRALALCSLWGSICSAAMAVFFIWLWGLKGIVPALLMVGIIQYTFSVIYSRPRIRFTAAWHRIRETFSANRHLLSMGGYLTISMGVTMGCSYLFIVYLNRVFNAEIVGFYQAGHTMLGAYAGTFFTAMSVEYFPRLSRRVDSNLRISAIVNQEITLILKLLTPIVVVFILCSTLLVRILYTSAWEPVVPFLVFGAPGLIFKAVSTCLAYTILAKGDGRTYIQTEITSSLAGLILYVIGFRLYGFIGLGVAFTLWYALYTAITYLVYRRRYGCVLRAKVWWLTAFGVILTSAVTALFILS